MVTSLHVLVWDSVGGGWRRIVNINVSAGGDCLGEWRKATQSGVDFCRVVILVSTFGLLLVAVVKEIIIVLFSTFS